MFDLVISPTGTPIRLPGERWEHILAGHSELIGLRQEVLATLEHPDKVLEGNSGEFLAVREREPGKWFVVVYRELDDDGFIITAFLTSRYAPLRRRKQLWP